MGWKEEGKRKGRGNNEKHERQFKRDWIKYFFFKDVVLCESWNGKGARKQNEEKEKEKKEKKQKWL